jgi:hypothetical protein
MAFVLGALLFTTPAHAADSEVVFTGEVAGRIGRSGIYDDRFTTYGVDLVFGGERRSDSLTIFGGGDVWGTLASTPNGRLVTAYGIDADLLFRLHHLRLGFGLGGGVISIARSTGPSRDSDVMLRVPLILGADVLDFSNGGGVFIDLRGVLSGYLSSVDLSLGVRFR